MDHRLYHLPSPLFRDIPESLLQNWFAKGGYRFRHFPKGALVYQEGEPCLTWDVILDGEVAVQRIDEKGNVLTISLFTGGDDIGGNLMYSSHPYYPMNIFSKSSVQILSLERDLVLNICMSNASFLHDFLKSISDKTSILTGRIKSMSRTSIRDMLMQYLFAQAVIQKSMSIELSLSKKDLAEYFGVARTSLSREMKAMAEAGLIDFQRRQVILKKSIENWDLARRKSENDKE